MASTVFQVLAKGGGRWNTEGSGEVVTGGAEDGELVAGGNAQAHIRLNKRRS